MIHFSEVSDGRFIILHQIVVFVHDKHSGWVTLSTGKDIPLTNAECMQLRQDLRRATTKWAAEGVK